MDPMLNLIKRCSAYFMIVVFAAASFSASADQTRHYIVKHSETRQAAELRDQVNRELKRPVEIRHSYSRIFSGFAALMTQAEANLVLQLPGVQQVVADEILTLTDTDNLINFNEHAAKLDQFLGSKSSSTLSGNPVVDLIGANEVWDGSATNDGGHLGEGVVIGIVGPGLINAHPIFDATGSDGFVHTNPLGDGIYLGDCFATPQHTCNSKLIGRYNFTNSPSPVADGLESYSANLVSLSAGNRLTGDSLAPWGVDTVSGIAPHANIIVYRTCPATSCLTSAVLQAFEQAIIDGVDVLINPIGGGSQSPWGSVYAPATLALRDNGVMLSQSAGNSGPAPGTLSFAVSAPWSSVFVSSTHALRSGSKVIGKFEGGDSPVPPTLQGGSIGSAVSAPIVYAGNIPNPNSTGNSALCLEPYPDSTLEGVIVVCDRGEIARVQKALNARDSGAIGFVLANVAGGPDNVSQDFYAVSGIHLNVRNSDILRSWLSTGSGHHATISASESVVDFDQADHLASTSGRGPIFDLDFLMPSGAIPAQNVVVASSPDLFALTSGPAAASAAGALALLKSARPQWSDAERLSALMTTGVTPLQEDDGITQTGTFAHGGGRVDLPAAVNAGLVLNETTEGFNSADPLTGGQPKNLNLAGLINLNCIDTCTWTRTLRATQGGNWNSASVIDDDNIQVGILPSTFSLLAGETQDVTVTFTRNGAGDGVFDGAVTLQPDNINLSATTLQMHVTLVADDDLDGISNPQDNCLNNSNPLQQDSDSDNYGNVCDADLNNDGVTNFIDLLLFSNVFQSDNAVADFNSDGVVNFVDLEILKTLFLSPPGPSGLASRIIG